MSQFSTPYRAGHGALLADVCGASSERGETSTKNCSCMIHRRKLIVVDRDPSHTTPDIWMGECLP